LSLSEISSISAGLGHIKFLSITGGEPSLRNDLPEIISVFSRTNQTHNVVLHTNGLLTEKIHDLVVGAALANPNVEINVSVSIDAIGEQHDQMRGVPGIFGKALNTVNALIRAKGLCPNINVTVNSCFNAHNQDEISRLSDYLIEECAIDGYYLSWVRGEAQDRESRNADIRKYLDEIRRLQRKAVIKKYYDNYPLASFRRTLDFLAPLVVAETVINGKMPYPCMAGRSVIVISESGEVKPCEMLKETFGNVRDHDYDLKKMLFTAKSSVIKRQIAAGNCCCTWECAVMNNLVFNWRAFPRVMKTWIMLEIKKRFGK
jgi:MoaA/NifB/PqqE/SkfB family radical SAM enzyme